jgi:hypothetical protein
VANTPNLKLELIAADLRNWAQKANSNYQLIDATVGAYFALQNLQGVWENSHEYAVGDTVIDSESTTVWQCQVDHISAMLPTTFAEDRADQATYWSVYSSPARARGTWTGPGTNYTVNDFVVSGSQYAVCIVTHVSGSTFAGDGANWSILVDLSQAGSQVLPIPGGAPDADKFVVTTPLGSGYTIVDGNAALALMGGTSLGISILRAQSGTEVRDAIGAQPAGSYQPGSSFLSAISGLSAAANTVLYFNASAAASLATISTFGLSLIDDANAAAARSTLGLGTAAVADTGTTAGKVLVLNGSAQIPAVSGALLTSLNASNIASGTLDPARGGYVPPPGYAEMNFTGYTLSSSFSTPMQITEGIALFAKSYTAENGRTVLIAVDIMNCEGQNTSQAISIYIDGAASAVMWNVFRFTNIATHGGSARVVYSYVSDGSAKTINVRAAGGGNIGVAVLTIMDFLAS